MSYYGKLPMTIVDVNLRHVTERIEALAKNDQETLKSLPESSYWGLLFFLSYHQYPLNDWWMERERSTFLHGWLADPQRISDQRVFEFLQHHKEQFGHLLENAQKVKQRDLILHETRHPHMAALCPTPLATFGGPLEYMMIFPRKSLKHFDVMEGKMIMTYLDIVTVLWYHMEQEARRVATLLTKQNVGTIVGLNQLLDPEISPVMTALRQYVPQMFAPPKPEPRNGNNRYEKPKGSLLPDLEDLGKNTLPPCMARIIYRALHKKEHPKYGDRVVFVPCMTKLGFCQEDIEQAMLKMYPDANGDVERLNSLTGKVVPHFYRGVVTGEFGPTSCKKAKELDVCPMGKPIEDAGFIEWYGAEKSRKITDCNNCGQMLPEKRIIKTPWVYAVKSSSKK